MKLLQIPGMFCSVKESLAMDTESRGMLVWRLSPDCHLTGRREQSGDSSQVTVGAAITCARRCPVILQCEFRTTLSCVPQCGLPFLFLGRICHDLGRRKRKRSSPAERRVGLVSFFVLSRGRTKDVARPKHSPSKEHLFLVGLSRTESL